MHKINLKCNNKQRLTFFILGLFSVFILTILMPIWFVNYLEFSGIANFFMDNIIYSIIIGFILCYQFVMGEYYYNISINNYVINIISYRPIFDFLKQKDYLDFPLVNLVGYAIFNRPWSLNKTLMVQVKTSKGKQITKRFNLTLISQKEVERISSVLDRVIKKNNVDGRAK